MVHVLSASVMFSKVFISGTIFPLPVGIVRFSTMHIAYNIFLFWINDTYCHFVEP